MIWLNIDGYDGAYKLSEKGELIRITAHGPRIIKSCEASNGKLCVTLWKNKKRKVFMLHNLYADTFNVSINDAMRIIYEGYEGNSASKDNVKNWLLSKISECEQNIHRGVNMNDEVLYLKGFLKQINE